MLSVPEINLLSHCRGMLQVQMEERVHEYEQRDDDVMLMQIFWARNYEKK